MIDRTEEYLSELEPRFAQKILWILNEYRSRGIPLGITEDGGKRSWFTQVGLYYSGASQTLRSKHLDGLAVDFDVLGISRDRIPKSFWSKLGKLGERHGLRWGGRFRGFPDLGHFEHI